MSAPILRTILLGLSKTSAIASGRSLVRNTLPLSNTFLSNKRFFSEVANQSTETPKDVPEVKETETPVKKEEDLHVDIQNDESFNGFVNSLISIIDSNKNQKADESAKENVKMFLSDPVIRKIYNECKHSYYKAQGLDRISLQLTNHTLESQPLPNCFNSEFIKMCQLESVLDPEAEEGETQSKYHVHKLSRPTLDVKKEIDFENLTKDFEFIKKEEEEETHILDNLIDNSHLKGIEDTTKFNPNNKVIHDILYAYKYLIDQIRSSYLLNGNEVLADESELEESKADSIEYSEILNELTKGNKMGQFTHATGKRKESTALVTVTKGNGTILINKRFIYDYFLQPEIRENIILPFLYVNEDITKYDIRVHVTGGGLTGQAEAIRLGIAKILASKSEEYCEVLKAADMLYRDPRVVERKKPGRRKARKPQQWVKR